MDSIDDSSRRIGAIIGVIDGIAFQTNILALNAAVEAARAGEHGRGFAVVASEVRSLALRSADAAKQVRELIAESMHQTESGAALVRTAVHTVQEIRNGVSGVAQLIEGISSRTRQQSDGIGAVNATVSQLDTMTQQNAALVEEVSSAAESLKEQANALTLAVGRFKLS
jgi:methyl-accepting chemotaxis protein